MIKGEKAYRKDPNDFTNEEIELLRELRRRVNNPYWCHFFQP
jgi:hypothetical protein